MTTGTEGPDNLQNDPNVPNETVDARGGDDRITIVPPTASTSTYTTTVNVLGGTGSDTMVVNGDLGFIYGTGFDGFLIMESGPNGTYRVDWSSIERLEVTANVHGTEWGNQTGGAADILRLTGDNARGFLLTHAGNDEVYFSGTWSQIHVEGRAGNDILDFTGVQRVPGVDPHAYGGDGNDILRGSAYLDRLFGDAGEDRLVGNDGTDYLSGGTGNDVIIGGREDGTDGWGDFVVGASIVNLSGSSVVVHGNTIAPNTTGGSGGTDTLIGIEHAIGTNGFDHIFGSDGANHLEGLGGDDYIDGGAGADSMYGGTGSDIYVVDTIFDAVIEHANGGVADEVRTTLSLYGLGQYPEVENLTFLSAGYNEGYGNDKGNRIVGNSGTDVLYGYAGNDVLQGNAGDDQLYAGEGNDTLRLTGGGEDIVIADIGDDLIQADEGLSSGDRIEAGAGNDRLVLAGDYWGAKAVTLNHVTGIESVKLTAGIETMPMNYPLWSYDVTVGDQMVVAGQNLLVDWRVTRPGENVRFDGSAETDGSFTFWAGLGIDTVLGGAGDDMFVFTRAGGFTPQDSISGGAGNDVLVLRGSGGGTFTATTITGIETIVIPHEYDSRWGEVSGTSVSITTHDANVAAGARLTVDASAVGGGKLSFVGMYETDGVFTLIGSGNADYLIGGQGADTITAGGGNDVMQGGWGGDTLTGGTGVDVFTYGSGGYESSSLKFDTLVDFKSSEDKLQIANTVSGWAGPVTTGQLDRPTFDADMAAAVNGPLGAYQAVLFTPDSGEFAGRRFLVVDQDGDGVYVANQDYVFELGADAVVDMSSTDYFI